MHSPLISKDIFPIGEFKKHASRLFRRVREERRPVIVTHNGVPVGVVVPPDEYDRLVERARFLDAVERGLAAAEAGRVLTGEEVDRELDRAFGPPAKSKQR